MSLGHWAEAIEMAANHFDTPIKTIAELIIRMHELFPEDINGSQFSAFNIISNTNTFSNGELTCIVIDPTKYLFEAYGRALNSDYVEYFQNSILSDDYKRELKERATWENERKKRS